MEKITFPSRLGTHSVKHDYLHEKFGVHFPDMIPLWVADMDLAVPTFLSKAISERAAHPIYGYTKIDIKPAIKRWQARHHFKIDEEWIIPLPNVVFGIGLAIQSFSKEEDKIIINPPVYPPFFHSIKNHKRVIASAPLKINDDRYVLDLASFDRNAQILILCNPHNPVGRVWTKQELLDVGNFCLQNGITIISDEIHADFIYQGHTHTPMASLSPEIANITVTLSSATKTFNISGLSCAYAIISNPKLRRPFHDFIEHMHLYPNIFGALATVCAYENGKEWPTTVMALIESNFKLVKDFFKSEFPEVKIIPPEGTYLLWLDFSDNEASHQEIFQILLKECHLALSCGQEFGKEKFFRLNLATSSEKLNEALKRLKNSRLKNNH